MISFDLMILRACLRVSPAARPADIALGRVNFYKNYHLCHKQSHPLLKSHEEFQVHILN